jgi:hypothetical protein
MDGRDDHGISGRKPKRVSVAPQGRKNHSDSECNKRRILADKRQRTEVNSRFPIRLRHRLFAHLRPIAAFVLAVSLLGPYLYGFAPEHVEKCSCCEKAKSCPHHRKTSHDGEHKLSSSSTCPTGCAQSPALIGAAPAVLALRTKSVIAVDRSNRLVLQWHLSFPTNTFSFALFQRPPPSV